MFHVCSFALAMGYFVWRDFTSGVFFGEPHHPFDE